MSTPADNSLANWNVNASFWDEAMGPSGNDYYTDLELPALKRMTAIQGGERTLDLATGNGLVARWLAGQGVGSVIATDGSEKMVECARGRGAAKDANGDGDAVVSYQVLDVTDQGMLEEFIEREVERVRTLLPSCLPSFFFIFSRRKWEKKFHLSGFSRMEIIFRSLRSSFVSQISYLHLAYHQA